jgi:hypothetical protein
LPKGRTIKYVIWRICERFGILPDQFIDSNYTNWELANFVSYENIREIEDAAEITT